MNTIFLNVQVLVAQTKCDGDLAPAHIMVSSPALPGLSDVVWVYDQKFIAIEHQSFSILIRERMVIVLGRTRSSSPVFRGLGCWGNVKRWYWRSFVRKWERCRSPFEILNPAISPRLPWVLWMLCCNSAIPSSRVSTPPSYLLLELLVDLIAICTAPLLRVIIDPIPKYTVICFRVSIAGPLRGLHNGPNAPDIAFRWPNLVTFKIL